MVCVISKLMAGGKFHRVNDAIRPAHPLPPSSPPSLQGELSNFLFARPGPPSQPIWGLTPPLESWLEAGLLTAAPLLPQNVACFLWSDGVMVPRPFLWLVRCCGASQPLLSSLGACLLLGSPLRLGQTSLSPILSALESETGPESAGENTLAAALSSAPFGSQGVHVGAPTQD